MQPDTKHPRLTARRWPRRVAIAIVATIALAAVVPMVWPVPPLDDVRDPRDLAGSDSRFVTVRGVDIHYEESGSPEATTTIICLHGFGASSFSWRDQLELLSADARVIAFDRPAFGLTERLMPGDWEGPSPYGVDENAEQVIGLMDALGVSEAVLVGHSAGCVVAVTVADTHPERVQALVLEAPALYEARSIPGAASALLRTPQMRRIGPLLVRRIAGFGSEDFVRSAYFDEGTATPEVLAGYRLPLSARDWDRALWELVAAPRPTSAVDLLPGLDVPTLVLAGRQDTFVPYENSVRVSEAISGAKLVSFERTGHLPHEEKPERFADEVSRLLTALER